MILRIESKMKEFETNFVESLLEGVKAKVISLLIINMKKLEKINARTK